MNYVMHDENYSSVDVIPNNDLFSQSMSYVTHGDNHPIDTLSNRFTPVMNPEIDDVIINNNLSSQSKNYVTHGACHSLHHVAQTMTPQQPQMTTLNNTVTNRINNHNKHTSENKLTKQSDSNLSIIVYDHISPNRHHNNPNKSSPNQSYVNNQSNIMEANTSADDEIANTDINNDYTKLRILSLNVCGIKSKLIIPDFSL